MCKFCKPLLKMNVGNPISQPYHDPRCTLKDADEETRFEINSSLLKLGLGGSMVNNGNCPLFASKNWVKCPWFEAV